MANLLMINSLIRLKLNLLIIIIIIIIIISLWFNREKNYYNRNDQHQEEHPISQYISIRGKFKYLINIYRNKQRKNGWKKVADLPHKNELLAKEINELKEENNSLKMKIRDLEQSSQSEKIDSLKNIISGQNIIIEELRKENNELFSMNDELKKQLNLYN